VKNDTPLPMSLLAFGPPFSAYYAEIDTNASAVADPATVEADAHFESRFLERLLDVGRREEGERSTVREFCAI
jgi:hypothetical protein